MLDILAEKIHDNRFLRLVRNMLQAGYLEDWEWNATLSGAPQGGVASPVLSNIYLHRLDTFVETVLIPEYTRGVRRASQPAYQADSLQRSSGPSRRGDRAQARQLRRRHAQPAQPGSAAIPATAGCDMSDTPMTTCSGSPDRRPKPNRSNSAWRSSCVTTSNWNCPRTRR